MAGIENTTIFSSGERLQPSSSDDISRMQEDATDVSRINHTGNPESVVSANPGSLCHDPVSGDIYYKQSGTGNVGWIPIFQPVPGHVAYMSDDFFGGSTLFGNSSLNTPVFSQDGHPGLIQTNYADISPPPLFNGFYAGDFANPYQYIKVGSGILTVNYVINLTTLSLAPDNYIAYFGLSDTQVISEPPALQNAIWFSYTDSVNSGNWTLNCADGGVVTSVDSGVPATTSFVNLGFRSNAAGTSIQFLIDGTLVGTINTNIPSANMNPFMNWSLYGTDPNSLIDLFSLTYVVIPR